MIVLFSVVTIIMAFFTVYVIKEKHKTLNKKELEINSLKDDIKSKKELILELEVELQQKKKEVSLIEDKLDLELKKLESENDKLRQTLVSKMQEYESRYNYLNNFLNNGVFYDRQNNNMVLISELIRVADFEDVEIPKTQES